MKDTEPDDVLSRSLVDLVNEHRAVEESIRAELKDSDAMIELLLDAVIVMAFISGVALLWSMAYLPALEWLKPLPGIFLTAASLVLVATTAVRSQKQFLTSWRQSTAQTMQLVLKYKEIQQQDLEKMAERSLNSRMAVLERLGASESGRNALEKARNVVRQQLRCILPYVANARSLREFQRNAQSALTALDMLSSEYIQQLLRVCSLMRHSAIVDYIWGQLYSEEQIICIILRAAGHAEVIGPSADQIAVLLKPGEQLATWDTNAIPLEEILGR